MVGNSVQRQTRINPMTTLSRRETLLAPVALAATSAMTTAAAEKKMTLAMHQNTSNGAGYRKSLEGWARAGIKDVEITNVLVDEFLKTDSLASARQVITDLGQNLVQGATGVTELFEPNPNRSAALGISPLTRILSKLSEKGYAGPLSVELFLPKFQQGDPYEVAREIRVKSEAVMHRAGVA
jgi:hypothetical protein